MRRALLFMLALILGVAGCDEPTRSVAAPPVMPASPLLPPPPAPASPAGRPHLPFPPLARSGAVYLGESLNGGSWRARYVVYDDGSYELQHAEVSAVYVSRGTYTRRDQVIEFTRPPEFEGHPPHRWSGTISDEMLVIARNAELRPYEGWQGEGRTGPSPEVHYRVAP